MSLFSKLQIYSCHFTTLANHCSTIDQPLANHWSAIGQHLANHWPTIGQPLASSRPTVGQPLANRWPTIGQQSANHGPTIGQPLLHHLQTMANHSPTIGHSNFCMLKLSPCKFNVTHHISFITDGHDDCRQRALLAQNETSHTNLAGTLAHLAFLLVVHGFFYGRLVATSRFGAVPMFRKFVRDFVRACSLSI